jgi:hypothetical protein
MLSFSGSLFAQAAAEAALAHGLSSSAGSAMGKTLGHALGNAAGQVGGKLGQQTSTTAPHRRVPASQIIVPKNAPATAALDSTPSTPGSLVVSIQGGEGAPNNCLPVVTAANAEPPNDDAKSSAPADANCSGKPAADAENHPAVLNFPAPN